MHHIFWYGTEIRVEISCAVLERQRVWMKIELMDVENSSVLVSFTNTPNSSR